MRRGYRFYFAVVLGLAFGFPPASGADPVEREAKPGGHFLDVAGFPQGRIVSGGPGKDGIPALTDPTFVDATHPDAAYLQEDDLVLGLAAGGEARAYPHNIGWWHEIVNDIIGGQPVVVSFCPLTGTGMVFNGLAPGGGRITAGVSGLLFNNNLIMYDRRDNRTLYPQMIFRGVEGPRRGEELELMPVVETTWRFWKRLHPNTKVISGNTGVYLPQQYEFYPYTGGGSDYRVDDSYILFSSFPAPNENPTWRFYGAKEMALGMRFGELAMAYPFPELGDRTVFNDTVAGNGVVIVWFRQERFAVPYFRAVDGRTLTFSKAPSADPAYPFMMQDRETGTAWNLKGEAVSGVLRGARLKQVPAHNAFWFAWSTFWQNTGVRTAASIQAPPPAVATKPSDFNGDGRVDLSDFIAFARNFGTRRAHTGFDAAFDLDDDGEVNFSDFVAFARAFGR